MDKTVAGLLGAVGALVIAAPGNAAVQPASPQTVLQAKSYTDLLRPIANARETLQAVDAQPEGRASVQLAEDDHHHHQQRYYRRSRRTYHHHHHSDQER